MKVCVFGLWHLGTVTAACLASGEHQVTGLDLNASVIRDLQTGKPPLFEPGLEDLVNAGIKEGTLRFTTGIQEAIDGVELVWVAFDTPVDDEDRADVQFVVDQVKRLFPHLAAGTLVLISSQLPAGTARSLERAYQSAYPDKPITFAYSPENLRLGKAISIFTKPDRVVVGTRTEADRKRIAELLRPFTENIEWMSVESAEMTKHALNAFLAISVTFANEVAILCEEVGADAKEVERGLKSESRIGPKAYLSPGGAFAGGTLARDISFLTQLGDRHAQATHLLSAVRTSNDQHKGWARRKLQSLLGDLDGKTVAVWGLTYKPGTDTLRRSSSIELCVWLTEQGARVQAHDPAVKVLPDDLARKINLFETPQAALLKAAALVIATEWPDYRSVPAESVLSVMAAPVIIDPNHFLIKTVGADPRFRYVAVGRPLTEREEGS